MTGLASRLRGAGKAVLLSLLRLLPRRGGGGPVDPVQVKSVLVIRTDERVGNLLLTTPLLAALRERLPSARIGLLCAARLRALVEGTGLYDELWPFEKREFFLRPLRFVRFCWRLRRARYSVAIEAGHWHAFSFTAGMLALWSGAPVRIGHRRGEAEYLMTHLVVRDPREKYDAATKLELLAPFGPGGPLRALRLQTALGRTEAARFVQLFKDQPALILNPGGRKSDHRWPPQLFSRAGLALRDRLGLAIWVAFGPGEEALARQVAAGADGARLLPETNLAELAGVLRACALFLTNDTGPMHLGAAVGAPTVAIFLNEDRERWTAPVAGFAGVTVKGLSEEDAVAAVVSAGMDLGRGGSADRSLLDRGTSGPDT
jgi:heptosyltransferase-3